MKRLLHDSPWAIRDVRLAGSAQAVTFLAGEVVVVALLLHAYAAGWGSRGTALLLVTAALPVAVGSVLAGPLVDRFSSRLLATGAAAWQALVCAAAAAAAASGAPGWLLVAALLLVQVGQAVAGPTWAALLPELVAREQLARTVGAVHSLVMLLGMAGPLAAGGAVAVGGVPAALGAAAVGYSAVAVFAALTRATRGGAGAPAEPVHVLDGLRFVRGEPVVRTFVVGFVAFVLAVEVVGVVLVLLVRGELGGSELDYGVVGSVMAVGLVVGTLLAGGLGAGRRLVRAAVVGALGMSLALVAGGLAPTVLLLGAAMLLLGVANGLVNVSAQTTMALRVPAERRGRVLGSVSGALRTASVLGLVAGGALGTVLGPRELVVGAGVGGLLVTAWLWRALWWRSDLEPTAPTGPATRPAGAEAELAA
ncbi:MFS transporter [Aquipuribacter nitratireducens]|uniref:MFS transporter n=1 Tax=Aquipuribacter nitratireducens TaxID=650104 RepID=A0ABW0GHU9_9MICO